MSLSHCIAVIESFNQRATERLTIEKIEALQKEAHEKDMDIDWETATLVPYTSDVPRESAFIRDDEGDHLRIDEQPMDGR